MATSFDITKPAKPTIPKDPNAHLDYTEDWANWLDVGDSISSADVVFSTDPDATLALSTTKSPNVIVLGTSVTAWLMGGTVGNTELATYRITTVAGRVDDRTLFFKMLER